MKLIIIAIISIAVCAQLIDGNSCLCSCCRAQPQLSCKPIVRAAFEVASCQSCTARACTNDYPSVCPNENGVVNAFCTRASNSSDSSTTQASGSTTGASTTKNPNGSGETTPSNTADSRLMKVDHIKYLFSGIVAFISSYIFR